MCDLFKLYLKTSICLLLMVLVAHSARAEQEDLKQQDRGGRRAEMRQKMLDEFDVDGDGELSDDERTTARQAMRSRRGDKEGRAKEGKRPQAAEGGRGAKGERVAKGKRGAKGRSGGRQGGKGLRGPGGPPDPGKLFDQYDANGDGQLSRDEFMKLTAAVRASRPPGGPGQRGGPPKEGRRRFEGQRPLQNPGDRSGPPPPPREGRRARDENGVQGEAGARAQAGRHGARRPGRQLVADRRGAGGRGAAGQGFGRPGPPDPARVFDRFDENGDDQLSREEFMKLADRMREMRDRGGAGGAPGLRDERGSRRGPAGATDSPRGRRPHRPETQRAEIQRAEPPRPAETKAADSNAADSEPSEATAAAASDDDAV